MAIPTTIKTGDITIRHVKLSDAKLFFEAEQDAEARRNFMSTPKNVKEVENDIKKNLEQYKSKKPTSEKFAIEYLGQVAGSVSINHLNTPFLEHKAKVSYVLHPEFRGKGIMTVAVKKVTEYAFKKYKLKRIEGWCRTFNKGSARVLEKAGFELEGILRKNKVKDGEYLDDMLWAIVR